MEAFWLMYWNVGEPRSGFQGRRLGHIADTISAVTTPAPALVAFSEVTNCSALGPLVNLLRERTGRDYASFNAHRDDSVETWLDCAVVYDRSIFDRPQYVAAIRGGTHHKQTRRCVAVRCMTASRRHSFDLYISHWWAQGGHAMVDDAKRREIARWMWSTIRESHSPVVLAVGDYNVEPYDAALLATMPLVWPEAKDSQPTEPVFGAPLTTRHASTATHSPNLPLYNATWQLLDRTAAPPSSVPDAATRRCAPGSYYFDTSRAWHAFDQLLVSSQLLGSGGVRLDRTSVHYATPQVVQASGTARIEWEATVPDADNLSDHYPLLARFDLQ